MLTARNLIKILLVFFFCLAAAKLFADEPSETFLKGLYEETVTGDLEKAVSFFHQSAEGAQDKKLVARALYHIGRCQEKLGKDDDARKTLADLVKRFPEDEFASLASQILSRLPPPEEERTRWINLCRQQTASFKEAEKSVRGRADSVKAIKDEETPLAVLDSKRSFTITDLSHLKELVKESSAVGLVARYVTSRVFYLGIGFYRNLQYEKAENQFSIAVALDGAFAPAKEYLEKTEFILGKRKTLSPELLTGLSATDEDPVRTITKSAEDALAAGQKLYEEKKYDTALEKFDSVESEVVWLASELVAEKLSRAREKAKLLGEDCLMNLFPKNAGEARILRQEREEAVIALKKALDVLLTAENDLTQRAHDSLRRIADNPQKLYELGEKLTRAGELQKAKEVLVQALSLDPANEAAKTLLGKVEESLKQPEKK